MRRKAGPSAERLPAPLVGLLGWLKQHGATFDDVELRVAGGVAGVGLFAKRDFSAGDTLAALPQSCALTASVALASELGAAVTAVVATGASARFISSKEIVPEPSPSMIVKSRSATAADALSPSVPTARRSSARPSSPEPSASHS